MGGAGLFDFPLYAALRGDGRFEFGLGGAEGGGLRFDPAVQVLDAADPRPVFRGYGETAAMAISDLLVRIGRFRQRLLHQPALGALTFPLGETSRRGR